MFLNLEYEEIFPYVCVYKNLIKKPEDIHNVLKTSLRLSEENPDKNFGAFPKMDRLVCIWEICFYTW
jgi:hypothetical protein